MKRVCHSQGAYYPFEATLDLNLPGEHPVAQRRGKRPGALLAASHVVLGGDPILELAARFTG